MNVFPRLKRYIFAAILLASSATFADYTETLLVLDAQNKIELPRNYRSTLDLPSSLNNTNGLENLRMIGSAQFSAASLKRVLQLVKTKKIILVDLRQESHGLLDGSAISWYAPKNRGNAGKTITQINFDQEHKLLALAASKEVKVYKILAKNADEIITDVREVDYAVKSVLSEEALANVMKIHYQRFYVQDFHAPTNVEVDRFMAFVKSIANDQWLYFHCRAGVGRTTTFMAMYDMYRNAKQVSFADILTRQKILGGKDLEDMPTEDNFKYSLAVKRLAFLKLFYQYTHDNHDNFKTSWSEWLANHTNQKNN